MSVKNIDKIKSWDPSNFEIRKSYADKVYFLPKVPKNASDIKKGYINVKRWAIKFWNEGLWFFRSSNKLKLLKVYHKLALQNDEKTAVIITALDKHIAIFNRKISSLDAKNAAQASSSRKKRKLEKTVLSKREIKSRFEALKNQLQLKDKVQQVQTAYPEFNDCFQKHSFDKHTKPSEVIKELIQDLASQSSNHELTKQEVIEKLKAIQEQTSTIPNNTATSNNPKKTAKPSEVIFEEGILSVSPSKTNKFQEFANQFAANSDSIEALNLRFNYEISNHENNRLAELIEKAPNLKHIEIRNYQTAHPELLGEAILKKKNLQTLHLPIFAVPTTDSFLKKLNSSSPKLEKLTIDPTQLTKEGLEILSGFTDLRDLSFLFDRRSPTPKHLLEHLSQGLPSVEVLRIGRRGEILQTVVDNIEKFPKLKRIDFSFPQNVIPILQQLPNNHQIQELNLDARGLVQDRTKGEIFNVQVSNKIVELINNLQMLELKKLKLSHFDFYNFGSIEYKALEELKTLEYLEVPYPANGNEVSTLKQLVKNLPNLKTLKIKKIQTDYALDSTFPESRKVKYRQLMPHELEAVKAEAANRPGFVIKA